MKKFLFFVLGLIFCTSTALASDAAPNNIPTDSQGKPVALQYYQYGSQDARAIKQYEEDTLRASAVLVGATGRSNSTAVTALETYNTAIVYLNVTVATRPDANESLDVVVETSHDGGTTWLRIARFTTVTATGNQALVLKQSTTTTPVASASSTDPSSGAISFDAFGSQMRVASTVTDASGANATFTFSVTASFKRE